MKHGRWRGEILVLAFLGVLSGAGIAGEISGPLREFLAGVTDEVQVPIIVRFAPPGPLPAAPADPSRRKGHRQALISELRRWSETSQASFRAHLAEARLRAYRTLWINNSLAMRVAAVQVPGLAAQPGVLEIGLDGGVALEPAQPARAGGPRWNLDAMRIPELWELGYDGQGVVVACLDTGVDFRHTALSGRYRGGNNSWFDPHGEHSQPYDADGHGTQVAGLLVGGEAGGTPLGAAPGARWIAAKIFDDSGSASLSDIHLSFQWVLDPDSDPATDDAPDIVNNSWGLLGSTDECPAEFGDDLAALQAAGILVVFAAGNEGPAPGSSLNPANAGSVLAVGAVAEGLAVAPFSSRGPSACDGGVFPAVVAPGVNVLTADLTFGSLFPAATTTVSGTSFAAPMVAGVLALLRGAFPAAGPATLEAVLRFSARDLGASGPDNDAGYGLVDALMAYALLLEEFPGSDRDNDGFSTALNGPGADCDDTDPTIHPGAAEVALDGVDQDCNGYDLTIAIQLAWYTSSSGTLKVIATSELLASGQIPATTLELDGFGPMRRRDAHGQTWWEKTVRSLRVDPGQVTVSGVEGSVSAPTQAR